jgi:hypothetical protein
VTSRAARAVLLLVAMAGVTFAACGGSTSAVQTLCDTICGCISCASKQAARCEEDIAPLEDYAEQIGCRAELERVLRCEVDHIACAGADMITVDLEPCTSQGVALLDCAEKSADRPCAAVVAATAKSYACAVGGGTGEVSFFANSHAPSECSGISSDQACGSRCVTDLTCDEFARLLDGDIASSFDACVQACLGGP